MSKKDEALKRIRSILSAVTGLEDDDEEYLRDAIKSLEQLIEQPAQQEPVAWMDGYRNIYSLEEKAAGCEDAVIPLVPATLQHWSDCAVHNEPAYPAGKCDCGGYTSQPASKPLTDEQEYEAIGTAGNDLLELAKRWADNEVHVYQFDNEARKIIKAVLHRAHAKGDA